MGSRRGAQESTLLEAQGTATPLGDPIEQEAARAVYGEGTATCWVPSNRTNLGHLEAAAGIAGTGPWSHPRKPGSVRTVRRPWSDSIQCRPGARMHPDLAVLARKYQLPPPLLADLEALLAIRSGLVSTVVADPGALASFPEAGLPRSERSGLLPARAGEFPRTFPGPLAFEHPSPVDSSPGDATPLPRVAGRYQDLGPIGSGGMGEVRRVRDVQLNRVLAMKTLHPALALRPDAVARFLGEAQATAQLQHPGVVPVHDIGVHSDGRAWFTMKEVRGRTLGQVLREVHAASMERWEPAPSGWTFRRLVASFLQACHAVAYAHDRGVVHRDLKPDNIMVGTHGETYVLDWGLAKIVGRGDPAAVAPGSEQTDAEGAVTSVADRDGGTRLGAVMGTPAYMAPEQARGEVEAIDPRTDVYALGAVLYEVLSGRPPYEGTAQAVHAQVLAGAPVAVGRAAPVVTFGLGVSLDDLPSAPSGPPLPEELVAACERAMARRATDRFPTALALAAEVESWLDGSRRREQALEVTARARLAGEESRSLMGRAASLHAESVALLHGISTWEPEERKAPGWTRGAEAEAAERAAELKELEMDQTLFAALQVAPDLPEAHAALAERARTRHAAAEAERDRAEQAKEETLLTAHAASLPEAHPVRQEMAAYLKGEGALTLVTDPPGAEVALFRYVERNRRLVEVFERTLGTTPLRAAPLAMGSYLCLLRHPSREEVRYPVQVARRGHWDGVPPGEQAPHAVWLPPRGSLAANELYVPAGWFRAGGDRAVPSFPSMRLWCDAFLLQRFPVTNRQFLAFLNDLVERGEVEEALRHAPRERAGAVGKPGALAYGFDGARFALQVDADGDTWLPDWPVVQVDWHGARAYLAWLASRTGRGWRLPGELEWEKAARGVDGRFFPWGDFLDPSWCHMTDSHRGPRLPAVADSYPVDTSPYGARGLGGNVQDWCLDLFDRPASTLGGRVAPPETAPEAPARGLRMVRGGTWVTHATGARSAFRYRLEPGSRYPFHGLRGLAPAPTDD